MDPNTFQDWLAAEAQGRDDKAEEALHLLFESLPGPVPSADFADRVLEATGLLPQPLSRPARALIAASLLLAGLASIFLVPVAVQLLSRVSPAEVLAVPVRGLTGLILRLDEAAAAWQFMARLGDVLRQVMATPPVALSLLTLTLLTALAARGLTELLAPQRSTGYV